MNIIKVGDASGNAWINLDRWLYTVPITRKLGTFTDHGIEITMTSDEPLILWGKDAAKAWDSAISAHVSKP